MKIAILTPSFSALPQPSVEDIGELADSGYRSIIGNRPDGEIADQPDWADIKAAATAHGMEAIYIPVTAGNISAEDVRKFRESLEHLPKPIVAFCRTGTRSTLLWALANQTSLTVDQRVRIAAKAGYDLEPFRLQLEREINHAQS